MADTSVRIVGEKALGRWFKGLGPEAERLAAGVAFDIGNEIRNETVRELKKHKPRGNGAYPAYDTGGLARSYGVDPPQQRRGEVKVIIGSAANYANAIEHGRKPGSMPPSTALHRWVQRKLMKQRGSGKDKSNTFDTIESKAYAVAKKIKEKGTVAHPHLVPAFDRKARNFDNEVRKALQRLG